MSAAPPATSVSSRVPDGKDSAGRDLRRAMRRWAALDLAVTALLVWPGTSIPFLRALYAVNTLFGGDATLPEMHGMHLLFVSLSGVLGVLWALARLLEPRPLLAALDSIGRVAVALFIALAVVGGKGPAILFLFVATELAGAVEQGYRGARTLVLQKSAGSIGGS